MNRDHEPEHPSNPAGPAGPAPPTPNPTADSPPRRSSPSTPETIRPRTNPDLPVRHDQDAPAVPTTEPVRLPPVPPSASATGPEPSTSTSDPTTRYQPGPRRSTSPHAVAPHRIEGGQHNSPYHTPGAQNPATRSNGSQPTSILQNNTQRPRPSTDRPQAEDMDNTVMRTHEDRHPLPAVPQDLHLRRSRIAVNDLISPTAMARSGIDYLIPVDDKPSREKTVGERLQPTLLTAIAERNKYAFKAKMSGFALNAAIGLQVLLSALTTGLSAATVGQQASFAPIILGSLSTLVASYLARARGSNEPELSITRVKDLERFIRECQAFQMDHGHATGDRYDDRLDELRRTFEELLGHGDGQRRLAPPV